MKKIAKRCGGVVLSLAALVGPVTYAGLPDKTALPNQAGEGINKSLLDQIGSGRGANDVPFSSLNLINHDPFRSVRRGRQLFQRKFSREQGQGPLTGDGHGDIGSDNRLGAGLGDSCSSCHGRPRGSAGFGGDVATHPDSRDAPHLFGLGLKEMLGDEITKDLRSLRAKAIAFAQRYGRTVTVKLLSKGINYGRLTVHADGSVDTSQVDGVDDDLRVKPFFHDGRLFSIRAFAVTAFQNELGMQPVDSDIMRASQGGRVITPTGMVLDGSSDNITAPLANDEKDDPDGDGVSNEVPQSLIDHMEMYLLNYFKPAVYEQNAITRKGQLVLKDIGCTGCHMESLTINKDRRVADVETSYNEDKGGFNHLFATATPLFAESRVDGVEQVFKRPQLKKFVVKNIYTDFKRHDLGSGFHERQYDGSMKRLFMTEPLWGVGSTAPYGHDGRSVNLHEVILRHGGEAQMVKERYAHLSLVDRICLLGFLESLVLFPPDDTASNLSPTKPETDNYPQLGHGSIKLPMLFNDPTELE